MTNNQLTDAQISNATLIRLIRWADEHKSHYVAAALRELQERRKADSEPVAYIDKQWTLVYYIPPMSMGLKIGDKLYRYAQPAPVVPVTDAMAYAFHHALTDSPLGDDDVEDIKAGLRAALVNVFDTQPAPVVQMVPEEPPEHRLPKGNSRDTTYRRGAIILGWKLCRAAMLNGGNS